MSMILIIFLSACESEDPASSQDNTVDYFPLAVGNYWIYNGYELDSASGLVLGATFTDSLVCIGTDTALGENCFRVAAFRNGRAIDTTFYRTDNYKIYELFTQQDSIFNGFDRRWFAIAAPTIDIWSNIDTIINSYSFAYDTFKVSGVYEINYSGLSEGTASVQINSVSQSARKFAQKADTKLAFTLRMSVNPPDSIPIAITRLRFSQLYFTKGIGPSKIEIDPSYTKVASDSSRSGYPKIIRYNGLRRELVRYRVAQ